MSKPREFWLDLAKQYGDPCDFVSEGKPNTLVSATNIHVIEMSAYQALEAENKRLRDVLGFYADMDSYYVNGRADMKNHIVDSDLEQILYHYSNAELLEYIGGKRARAALKGEE